MFVAFEAPGYWLQAIEFGEMEIYRVPGTFTFAATWPLEVAALIGMLSRAKKIALATKAKITQFKDFMWSPEVYTQQIFKKLADFFQDLFMQSSYKR
ncbi:MAG: hypothetical protein ACPLYE_03685 [Candidatus Micrarchaeales archaeon]